MRPLLVLDIDGVMIEADRSFMEAVARAMGEMAPGLVWADDHFRMFKRVGGFNNDFRLAAGGLALHECGQMERLWAAEGVGFPDLEARIHELEPTCQRVVQKHYAITRHLETPLISLQELEATGLDLAIYTGRPPEEVALAIEVLGFELPTICDSAPHLRKPRPDGLFLLADQFQARSVVFAGDTRDDATALRAAREQRPDIAWIFAAIGPERAGFARPGDLQAPSLRALLPQLKGIASQHEA
jgi:phosphoglycolate phosphatase-like HAD superfamily hydrolase